MYLNRLIERAGRGHIPLATMGSGNNIEYLRHTVLGYGLFQGNDIYDYAQGEIPRVNPTDTDIRDSGAPKDAKNYNLPHGNNAEENVSQWLADNSDMGDIFRHDDGTYTGKPVGHFDIVAKLVLSRRLLELTQRGVKVLHIANGDDVGALMDPAKADYLMARSDLDMLALFVEKNTQYGVSKADAIFSEELRAGDKDAFGGDTKDFRIIARGGKIIRHNLPKGVEPRLTGDNIELLYDGKVLKTGIEGKREKGGTFVHVASQDIDIILDQSVPGRFYSANHFYIKVDSLLRLFNLDLKEYVNISQEELFEKVRAVAERMKVHVEVKPIAVGKKTLPDGREEVNMRPAAQFMRYLGEITGLKEIQTELILIDRDAEASDAREGYCTVKSCGNMSR